MRSVGLVPLLLSLAACSPVFYAPNVANAPLLRDDEIRTSGHFGGGDEVDHLFQVSVAGSFRTSLGVYASGYLAGGSNEGFDGNTTSGSGSEWDLGVGYHKFFGDRFGVESIAGFQYGRGSDSYQDGVYRVSYSAHKPFAQLNVGYRGRIFEAVFAERLSRLAYAGIREHSMEPAFARPIGVAELLTVSPSFLYEPSVSVRVGREPVKFGFDLGGTRNVTNPALRYDQAMVAIGVYYSMTRR